MDPWLVVSIQLNNMLVKLDHFAKLEGENLKKNMKPPPIDDYKMG